MNESTQKIIDVVKNRLIEIYHPKYIYLFGSYAWGEPDVGSDIDLCIIVDDSELSMTERMRVGFSELWDISVPFDLIVYTENELNDKKDHPSSLPYKILHKGVKLYEAA